MVDKEPLFVCALIIYSLLLSWLSSNMLYSDIDYSGSMGYKN